MVKLLSLIGSLGLTTSTLMPVSGVIGNSIKEKQIEHLDIGDFRPVTVPIAGSYWWTIQEYETHLRQSFAEALRNSYYIYANAAHFDVVSITNDFTGEPITNEEANGSTGPGEKYYTAILKANEIGEIFGFTGQASVTLSIDHGTHDLSIDRYNTIHVFNYGTPITVEKAAFEYNAYVRTFYGGDLYNPLSKYANGALEYTNYLINPQGQKLTNEELSKIVLEPQQEVFFHLRVRATQYGVSKGITGSEDILFRFYNPKEIE
ncbi:hypothetical protein [Spiroplasma sp. BIUS-1]|uniref:hypothetical protein n=1 Tax=Spiroplasma sp. BIUS-1 TaxID=216964 RepID=UPI001396FB94|nr:hypothetical protein [Spiroplasma sp. BIUS-1]QHX36754.1 hypothetical protein SBIUS_v1c05010 [Spiroplasma sp. BIUS-1]